MPVRITIVVSRFRFGDGSMERLTLGRKIGILAVLAATLSLTAHSSFSETAACRTAPGAPAPQGMHWYYRVDRTNDRQCWYLDSAGIQVRSQRNAATSNPTQQSPAKQDPAEQARAPSSIEPAQTASSRLANAETEPAKTPFFEPSVGEPTAPASAETMPLEPPSLKSSVGEPAATDFTARWLDLPKSVDLNMPEFATPRSNYANEHLAVDSKEQMPSTWFAVQVTSDSPDHTSTGMAKFGSIFLAGALGMLLYGGALKLTRLLHSSRIRRLTSNKLPY